jgi:hypothetical protein
LSAQSIGPMIWRALRSGQLFNPQCELTPADPDVLCEYDVEVPMSDGTKLLATVFRSHKAHASGARVSVVMCAHPYDNHLLPRWAPYWTEIRSHEPWHTAARGAATREFGRGLQERASRRRALANAHELCHVLAHAT